MKHSLESLPTEARGDKSGEPCPRHVTPSRIFMGLHTETVSSPPESPAVLEALWGENCPSPQLATRHGGNCPPLVWEVLRQDFASGQVLGECNFLWECLAHNWILADVSAGDVSMSLMQRLTRSEKPSRQEAEHAEHSPIGRAHHCVTSYSLVLLCSLLSRSCWKEIRKPVTIMEHKRSQKWEAMRT